MTLVTNMQWSPSLYNEMSVVAQKAGEEMISRLDWMTLQPAVVMDLGCGTCYTTNLLQKRYPQACVVALDHSEMMLNFSKQQYAELSYLQADVNQLPLANQSVDLVFANFLLPWIQNWESLFRECRRILKPNGLLMGTALGPDTLKGWHLLQHAFIPSFIDMHDLGDMLLQERLVDPVLDVDYYTIQYQEKRKLFLEMQHTGMWLAADEEEQNNLLNNLLENTLNEVTYEVIFMHAFAPQVSMQEVQEKTTVKIPLSTFRKQLLGKE